jgi:spore maturation protein CgeB
MTKAETLILVGNGGFAQVADSLRHAATSISGIDARVVDVSQANSRWRFLNSLSWRLLDHRPPFARRVARDLLAAVRAATSSIVLTTGLAPVEGKSLRACRMLGARCLHFSTDDPWNPNQSARWLNAALPLYDIVFTPRTSNMGDFQRLGCRDVRYLPFGYDERLLTLSSSPGDTAAPEVLFVGGADADRAAFFEAFVRVGTAVSLVGGFWDRHAALRSNWLGHRAPGDVVVLTRAAKVNLVLVRHANRDGHVMRSLEAGAMGGCLAVEESSEHLAIFGPDGESVRYFRSPEQAADLCRRLILDDRERSRLSAAVGERIRAGGHSYADRLLAMLHAAGRASKPLPPSPAGVDHG